MQAAVGPPTRWRSPRSQIAAWPAYSWPSACSPTNATNRPPGHAIGEYAASRADVVIAVGQAARPIADGAGERAVALADNGAVVDWLRAHLAACDVVLVKASRAARLDEVAAALGS